MVDDEGV